MKKEYDLIWEWSKEQIDKICAMWELEKDLCNKQVLVGKLQTLNELRELLLKVGYQNEN